jgi:hypothetical protein
MVGQGIVATVVGYAPHTGNARKVCGAYPTWLLRVAVLIFCFFIRIDHVHATSSAMSWAYDRCMIELHSVAGWAYSERTYQCPLNGTRFDMVVGYITNPPAPPTRYDVEGWVYSCARL